MKYVALLSGGKDSCYNLVHCASNGHELLAAASLRPEIGKEEIDSYLYQTVGQDAIEFVAQALEVPLYRQVIQGTAVEQGSEYGGRNTFNAGGVSGDETEDLYVILSRVKEMHPDIQGVSVGAILSNYQRVRVEHVCRRLGLTPLCYLWQRNQADLLDEMIKSGMEAILIKVAGIGLTKAHLGKTLGEMQPTLTRLNSLYGSHICGEGGEYESLTLDCPLFKRRIVLTETETIIHSDNDFATVAFLRIKAAQLEAKASGTSEDLPTMPSLLDEKFDPVRLAVQNSEESNPSPHLEHLQPSIPHGTVKSTSRRTASWVVVSNVQVPTSPVSLEDEVHACFSLLSDKLSQHGLQLSNCAIINICISSMDDFLRVNTIYALYFGVSPPARACVGVDLPDGMRVSLEAIAFAEQSPSDRQALHVQGLSYWAPANIGPYSQAIVAGEHVFISGQIGLIPSQLALPSPQSLALEMALSCQHISRITSALVENTGNNWIGHTQSCIYWLARQCDLQHVRTGAEVLEGSDPVPTLFIVVKELPKGALVEKQVLLHTGRVKTFDDDGNELVELALPRYKHSSSGEMRLDDPAALYWESCIMGDGSSCVLIFVKGTESSQDDSKIKAVASTLSALIQTPLSIRSFVRSASARSLVPPLFGGSAMPITEIPCRCISSRLRDDWDAALCVISPA